MRQKYTVYVLSNSGKAIKQVIVSKMSLCLLTFCLLSGIIYAAYMGYHYHSLKKVVAHSRVLEKKLANEVEVITGQRRQIQKFADDINALKSKIIALSQFEKKIRIIANFEKDDDDGNLFGVGGSIPEDLDTQLPINQNPNGMIREMHEQMDQMDIATANQEAEFEVLMKDLESKLNFLASTPAIRPTKGWITSRFGHRVSPFTGRREVHKGLDIATRQGTPIIATADGIITFCGKKGLLGNAMIIDHGHGMVTRYGHIHEILKKKGDRVKRGEQIALVGNTGRSTGPHVHYEVQINGVSVNPEKYILN